jgi:Fe-S-cluster-containing hydrogenase component 2
MSHPRSGGREGTILELVSAPLQDRRSFIKTLALGGLTVTVGGLLFSRRASGAEGDKGPSFTMILVDFNKCTGCRTCETVCAQFNNKVTVDGEELLGLGNPYLANIRVYPFNPDADVPIVCVMCGDNPCIEACPVAPDGQGRRALYRDSATMAIRNDPARCLACGACAEACRTRRVGAIIPNRETKRPERMCTLCGGKPQCVQYCPFDALSQQEGDLGRHYGLPAETIAEELIQRWYGRTLPKGGAAK